MLTDEEFEDIDAAFDIMMSYCEAVMQRLRDEAKGNVSDDTKISVLPPIELLQLNDALQNIVVRQPKKKTKKVKFGRIVRRLTTFDYENLE